MSLSKSTAVVKPRKRCLRPEIVDWDVKPETKQKILDTKVELIIAKVLLSERPVLGLE